MCEVYKGSICHTPASTDWIISLMGAFANTGQSSTHVTFHVNLFNRNKMLSFTKSRVKDRIYYTVCAVVCSIYLSVYLSCVEIVLPYLCIFDCSSLFFKCTNSVKLHRCQTKWLHKSSYINQDVFLLLFFPFLSEFLLLLTPQTLKHLPTFKTAHRHKHVELSPCLQIWWAECFCALRAVVLMIKPIMSRQQVYYTEVWPRSQLFSVYHLPPLMSLLPGVQHVVTKQSHMLKDVCFFHLTWFMQSWDVSCLSVTMT